MSRITRCFNYESECQRIDAPKEDMLKFLENQALEIAYREHGGLWGVIKTLLVKRENGSHHCFVTVEREGQA